MQVSNSEKTDQWITHACEVQPKCDCLAFSSAKQNTDSFTYSSCSTDV